MSTHSAKLRRLAESYFEHAMKGGAIETAAIDALLNGYGMLRLNSDGTVEHIPSETITVRLDSEQPPAAAPDGMVLVPRVPTKEMRDAVIACVVHKPGRWEDGYDAMLAAAPAPPAVAPDDSQNTVAEDDNARAIALVSAFAEDVVDRDLRVSMRRVLNMARRMASPAVARVKVPDATCHGLDTPERVCFYEQEFYPLSNFSSFAVVFRGYKFPTSEAAYHAAKFPDRSALRDQIRYAKSAHEAFKMAERNKDLRRPDWDVVKVDVMREIIAAKADQHEYVRRKLLQTGDRELVENSWRDDFWGWGPNRDGQNMLGKLWMELREVLRLNPPGPAEGRGDG